MSTILITGATGALGGAVANFLKNKNTNQTIAVLVRDKESDKAQALAKEGFELRMADYNNKTALEKAFTGVDTLYFVSGSDIPNRLKQHQNVVEAAKATKVGHLFYTSASLNGLEEDSPLYAAMSDHIKTEEWIKESGLNYTLLRHNLYSEVIPMFLGEKQQLMATKTVFLPAGEGKTAFVPRIELAELGANLLAEPKKHLNKAYELNGTEKATFGQIADKLSDITGESIQYVSPDLETFEKTMKENGVPDMYIGMMSMFGVGIKDGVFDSPSSDLQKLLGRESLPVKQFLETVYK